MGQRAYVRISGPLVGECQDKFLFFNFEIHNDGNTPAKISGFQFTFQPIGLQEPIKLGSVPIDEVVNGHSSIHQDMGIFMPPSNDNKAIFRGYFLIKGSMSAIDVFGVKQNLEWMWNVQSDPFNVSSVPIPAHH